MLVISYFSEYVVEWGDFIKNIFFKKKIIEITFEPLKSNHIRALNETLSFGFSF